MEIGRLAGEVSRDRREVLSFKRLADLYWEEAGVWRELYGVKEEEVRSLNSKVSVLVGAAGSGA